VSKAVSLYTSRAWSCPGNTYQIKNLSQRTEAELIFSQSRKIRKSEEDDVAEERVALEMAAKKAERLQKGRRKSSSLPRVDEDEEEEVDEGDTIIQGKTQRRRWVRMTAADTWDDWVSYIRYDELMVFVWDMSLYGLLYMPFKFGINVKIRN
jgi:hypothetical protein